MDQKSSFHQEAKLLLNTDNKTPFNDTEIDEILNLLEVFVDIFFNNIST